MSVGNRVYLKREMPDPQVMAELGKIPASNIADVMNRSCAMHPRIRLLSRPKAQICFGPALTVKGRGGDNLMLHQALNMAQPGDFIVVSNDEEGTRSLIGEVMMSYLCEYKKAAGIVLDGPIRDIDEIGGWDFPVYATGTTPGGPYKEGPGEINVPVSCGGISVHPGDVVLGDPDGVIVIPRRDAVKVLEEARRFREADEKKLEAARTGAADRSWVEASLKARGVEIVDDLYRP